MLTLLILFFTDHFKLFYKVLGFTRHLLLRHTIPVVTRNCWDRIGGFIRKSHLINYNIFYL